jgi:hypothetical protein
MDYGKLAELYGGFLVAIGGVSITVLTLVMSIWNLKIDSAIKGDGVSQNKQQVEVERAVNINRSALIKALIVATFCSFVGAHLMAETAAFVVGHPKGFGARQFLLASMNIFIGVTLLMFALMLLATEYKKENQRLPGIRRLSVWVFVAVVFCVLWWMFVSIFWRMPPPHRVWTFLPALLVVLAMGVVYAFSWKKPAVMEALLRHTFGLVISFILLSLIWFSCSLYEGSLMPDAVGGSVGSGEAVFFVATITFTCVSLLMSGPAMVKPSPTVPS